MGKKGGNPQNLKPVTKEQARILGRNGGLRSVEVKREKKIMSQIYADILAGRYEVKIDDELKTVDGSQFIRLVAKKVLSKGGSPAVAMMKEMREATETKKTPDAVQVVIIGQNIEGI
jgi:hypothetical protein